MPRGVSPQSGSAPLASIHSLFQISLLGLVASYYLALAGSGFPDLPSTLAAGLAVGGRLLLVALNRELPLRGSRAVASACENFGLPGRRPFLSSGSDGTHLSSGVVRLRMYPRRSQYSHRPYRHFTLSSNKIIHGGEVLKGCLGPRWPPHLDVI